MGTGAGSGRDGDELLDLEELADLTNICGQGNRAARHACGLVERFHRKSIESGSFLRDVRKTPTHLDEVVVLTAPHLPRGRRGPEALPPACRVFVVLFSLAQGGRQRVVSRAMDVAASPFGKFCTPVVQALCLGLPAPVWPGPDERCSICIDFSRMTGAILNESQGLYVYYSHDFVHCMPTWMTIERERQRTRTLCAYPYPEPCISRLHNRILYSYHFTWNSRGAVDGCHTPLLTLFGEHKEDYRNKNATSSLLVLAIADTRRIRYLVGRFPGSCGDSAAFKGRSWFKVMLLTGSCDCSLRGEFILGDAGSGITPLLVRFFQERFCSAWGPYEVGGSGCPVRRGSRVSKHMGWAMIKAT